MVSNARVRIDGGASYTPDAGLRFMVTTSSWHIRLCPCHRWPLARARGARCRPRCDGLPRRSGTPRSSSPASPCSWRRRWRWHCRGSSRSSSRSADGGCAGLAVRGLVLAARVPLTAAHRHRCWSLLGVDIPRAPVPSTGSLPRRLAGSLRSESTWRQLGYHLIAGPALALGGLLTLAAWAAGAGLVVAFAYHYVFPPLSQAGSDSPKFKVILTAAGALMLLLAPVLAAVVTWLDTKVVRALLGPSRSVELERRVESLSESRAGVVDAADAERRRIERDLHDGAQQRLVSLAMNLGMARENLTELPAAGQAGSSPRRTTRPRKRWPSSAPSSAGCIRRYSTIAALMPPCPGSRARAPLPVKLVVDMPARASPTVEAVAYFVASECLANIARHAAATQAEIDVRRTGGAAADPHHRRRRRRRRSGPRHRAREPGPAGPARSTAACAIDSPAAARRSSPWSCHAGRDRRRFGAAAGRPDQAARGGRHRGRWPPSVMPSALLAAVPEHKPDAGHRGRADAAEPYRRGDQGSPGDPAPMAAGRRAGAIAVRRGAVRG